MEGLSSRERLQTNFHHSELSARLKPLIRWLFYFDRLLELFRKMAVRKSNPDSHLIVYRTVKGISPIPPN